MKKIINYCTVSAIILSVFSAPSYAVDVAPRISDREIIEKLAEISGSIKKLETDIKGEIKRVETGIKGEIKRLDEGQKAILREMDHRFKLLISASRR